MVECAAAGAPDARLNQMVSMIEKQTELQKQAKKETDAGRYASASDLRSAMMEKMQAMIQKYHYSAFGGAPLLGVDGVCIICHGSSKERAIANALTVAAQNVRIGLNAKIVEALEALPSGD